MAQETSRPHILHLGSLVIPRLLRFSISLSLCEKKSEASTRSPPRLLQAPSVPRRRFTGDACPLRSLLLFSSLLPVDFSLSLFDSP
ncbi:hypothetical protein Bca101_034139 [Brassica carinata]